MKKIPILIYLLLSLTLIVGSLFVGPEFISPFGMTDTEKQILFSIRLPRIVVALLMGFALGASGAVLQGFLRNPLADPYILGISSGAALLAVTSVVIGATSIFGFLTMPIFAFIGAVITGLLVGVVGYKGGVVWPERLLLAGIGIGFLATAVLMLLLTISSDNTLRRSLLWVFGDLSLSDWSLIPYGAILILIGFTIIVTKLRALNALILGDSVAYSLGFNNLTDRVVLFIGVSLMAATAVSLGGVVGFVGLLVPHIVRFLGGSDSRFLVPLSALTGSVMLVVADTIGRTIVSPIEIPAGIITAIIGGPYFLYLLRKKSLFGV